MIIGTSGILMRRTTKLKHTSVFQIVTPRHRIHIVLGTINPSPIGDFSSTSARVISTPTAHGHIAVSRAITSNPGLRWRLVAMGSVAGVRMLGLPPVPNGDLPLSADAAVCFSKPWSAVCV
nr:hypothetical protein Itr_chr14CG09600 [Ipomoea trifida]